MGIDIIYFIAFFPSCVLWRYTAIKIGAILNKFGKQCYMGTFLPLEYNAHIIQDALRDCSAETNDKIIISFCSSQHFSKFI